MDISDTSSSTENVLINQVSLETNGIVESLPRQQRRLGTRSRFEHRVYGNNDIRLWIGSESDRGVSRVNPENYTIESVQNLFPAAGHSTP